MFRERPRLKKRRWRAIEENALMVTSDLHKIKCIDTAYDRDRDGEREEEAKSGTEGTILKCPFNTYLSSCPRWEGSENAETFGFLLAAAGVWRLPSQGACQAHPQRLCLPRPLAWGSASLLLQLWKQTSVPWDFQSAVSYCLYRIQRNEAARCLERKPVHRKFLESFGAINPHLP